MNILRTVTIVGLLAFRACDGMTLEAVFNDPAVYLTHIPRELKEKILGMTALHLASRDGQLKVVEACLKNPAEALYINTPDMLGQTPLTLARNNGHTAIVEELELHLSMTPLHLACRDGALEVAQSCLADPTQAADINKLDKLGRTPLILACDNGHHQIVALLVSAGAKKDVGTFPTTRESATYADNPGPWLVAAQKGYVEVIKLLLAGNDEPQSLLIEAAQNGEEAVVATLLAAGIGPDAYGTHDHLALHLAALNGHANIVKVLVDAEAELDITNDRGETPLHLAAKRGQAAVVAFLLSRNAVLDPLLLFSSAINGHVEVVKLLLKHYESFRAGKDAVDSLLSTAIKMDQRRIVETLLAAGLEPNHQDQDVWPHLCTAAHKGHLELVQMLLNAGAHLDSPTPKFARRHVMYQEQCLKLAMAPEQNTFGCTPLALAAQQGHTAIVEELLARRANPNSVDDYGWTPLCRAAYNGHVSTVQALLAKGALGYPISRNGRQSEEFEDCTAADFFYASARDHFGETPLGLAVRRKHADVIQLLVATGAIVTKIDSCNNIYKTISPADIAAATRAESTTPARTAEDAELPDPDAKKVKNDDASRDS